MRTPGKVDWFVRYLGATRPTRPPVSFCYRLSDVSSSRSSVV